MAKNDFDVDFDFEKEYGFDPEAVLDSDYSDDELDLSAFEEELKGLGSNSAAGYDDFDLDDIDLDGLGLDEDEDVREKPAVKSFEKEPDEEPELDLDDLDFGDASDEEPDADPDDLDYGEETDYDDDEDLTAGIDFSRRSSFFGVPEEPAQTDEPELSEYEEQDYEPETNEESVETEAEFEGRNEEEDYPVEDEDDIPDDNCGKQRRRERVRREKPEKPAKPPIKLTVPPFLKKLVRLYFPTQQEINERIEGSSNGEGRRRRRPSKQQIFKEFYLPTVIAGIALVLVFSFVIGSVSNSIDRMQVERETKQQQALQESQAAELLASEAEALLSRAEVLALGYNYQEAVDLLDTYSGEMTQEMTAKRAEYVNAKSSLVEHQDPTLIPNLSFHVLIHDMNRALADDDGLAGQYNRNFVTTEEFSKILEQLYMNNYVLVNFDNFVSSNSVDGTTSSLFSDSIWLPEGKKPVMITETMVNYFYYMCDPNEDGIADADGDGFASRLVVDANGDIKAEYVDANGVTSVGNYDLVPILEDFIAKHPDFSYRGARATLAVSGSQGIFGYRIQSEAIAKKGNDYYNEQVVGATKVVEALKAKGYRLACYSFDNKDYKNISAAMIQEDLQKWKSQISPVIGELDTIVFARGSDIGDYTGGKFDVLKAAGFRFLIKSADVPYTEVNDSYVRQSRLMVTGENMVAKASSFSGIFDPNTVLDLATRGNVPVG